MACFITLEEYNKRHRVPLTEKEYKALFHKELEECLRLWEPKFEYCILMFLVCIVAMISENFLVVFDQIKSFY